MAFERMDIIDNAPGFNILSGPVRVIDIQFTTHDSLVWIINQERPHKSRSNQRKGYKCKPYSQSLTEINEHVRANRCIVLNIRPTALLQLKDSDLLAGCKTEMQRIKLEKQFRHRDARFAAIQPLVCTPGTQMPRSIAEVVNDPTLPRKIQERAKELGCAVSTVRSWMNQYWAGGCQRSSLMAGYHGRCGNPGQEKKQDKKLGRSPRLHKTGQWPTRGYPLSYNDKQKLACGYALITRERTPRDAYLLTAAAHWATHEINATGEVHAILFDKEARPSFDQFMRWGARLCEKTVKQILLGDTKWEQKRKTRGNSEQDSILAIGQQAMFDGTSTDVYLTSFRSRLQKLPPLTRLILKESRSGIIYGIYCGWEAPSSQTALLTILHGALNDKRAWARRFGVEIEKDAIPGILSRGILADSGELKGETPTEFENQFGVGIEFAPAGRGDGKGGIETEHMRMHSHFDHRLPGTTHGKRRSRGDTHPAIGALWNYPEYMRELIQWVVWHNTVEEVPDLAPADMLLAQTPVKPTRINIYRWLTQKGLNVSLPVDYDALRAFTLPDVDAVICRNGVRLIGQVHDRKTRLLRLRYTSQELANTGLLTQVKVTGKDVYTRVKMDPNDLSQAWLPTRAGMIRLSHSTRDNLITNNMVLREWENYCEQQAILNDLSANEREQHRSEVVLRRHAITDDANLELKAAVAQAIDKPSKKALLSNLDENRRREIEYLRNQERALEEEFHEPLAAETAGSISHAQSPADHAMQSFLEEL